MKNVQPVYFLDSSLILKRYFREPGTDQIIKLFGTSIQWCTASLSYAEVFCTFKRLHKTSVVSAETFKVMAAAFRADWTNAHKLEFTREAQSLIPEILQRVYLKGADAVQLSTALALKNQGISVVFGTSDQPLLMAAKLMRLETLKLG